MMFYRTRTWDLSPHGTHGFHPALTPLTQQLLSTVESGETPLRASLALWNSDYHQGPRIISLWKLALS